MLSARELDVEQLADQARTWTNERLVYTHGYGITAVPVDAVTPQGTAGLPGQRHQHASRSCRSASRASTSARRPSTYVVTGTTTAEFDYPLERVVGGRRHDHLEGHDRRRRRQLLHRGSCSRCASATSTC